MIGLLGILAGIALLDSTSMIPMAVLPLSLALAGVRPVRTAGALIAGIFLAYTLGGLLVMLGLNEIFDDLSRWLVRWLKAPNTVEILVQIAIGLVMVTFAFRLAAPRERVDDRGLDSSVGSGEAFTVGVVLIAIGLPGALPYFAAIDQILRADLSTAGSLLSILFYNAVFALPLLALVGLRVALGERADGLMRRLAAFMEHWGHRLVVTILVVVGALLAADGVGWLLDRPVLPTFD